MKPRKHRTLLIVVAVIFVLAVMTNIFVLDSRAIGVAAVALGILLIIGVGVYAVKKAKGHYR